MVPDGGVGPFLEKLPIKWTVPAHAAHPRQGWIITPPRIFCSDPRSSKSQAPATLSSPSAPPSTSVVPSAAVCPTRPSHLRREAFKTLRSPSFDSQLSRSTLLLTTSLLTFTQDSSIQVCPPDSTSTSSTSTSTTSSCSQPQSQSHSSVHLSVTASHVLLHSTSKSGQPFEALSPPRAVAATVTRGERETAVAAFPDDLGSEPCYSRLPIASEAASLAP